MLDFESFLTCKKHQSCTYDYPLFIFSFVTIYQVILEKDTIVCGYISGRTFVPANIFQDIWCGVSMESSGALDYKSGNIIIIIYEKCKEILEFVRY